MYCPVLLLSCRFVQGFKMHLAYAEAVSYPGGLVLKRIRGSINQTCTDTGKQRGA
jgi:hypothetical protein